MNSSQFSIIGQNDSEISCNDEIFSNNLNTTTSIIWGIIAIIGIFANGTVLVVIFLASKLTSATQYFIINLAISDLIFLAICPTFLIMNYQTKIYNHLPLLLGRLYFKLYFIKLSYFCYFRKIYLQTRLFFNACNYKINKNNLKRFLKFKFKLTVFITCLTLTSMTFDRYQVIMDPFKAMTLRTTKKAVLTNVSIWISNICFM